MKKTLTNMLVILVVLGITGAIRLPFEQKLSEEMREAKLIPPRFDMEARAQLKQKSFAAAFGSLRPAMASMISITAIDHFKNQEWDQLEQDFTDATLLDPRNVYYWDTGSWHLATNASSDLQNNRNLSQLEREKGFREYIQRGKDFLDRGISMNPDSWKIRRLKATLQANSFRLPNYEDAVKTYDEILSMDSIPADKRIDIEQDRLSSLIKIPSMHQEAYDAAYKLYHSGKEPHFPLVLMALQVGQNHPLNKINKRISLPRMYGGDKVRAYKDLLTYWLHKDELEQSYGIKEGILELEKHLSKKEMYRVRRILRVPPNKNLFSEK